VDSVGVSGLLTALARHDEVAAPRSNAGAPAGDQIPVTPITREPFEPSRQRQPVPLGDPPGPSDVLPGETVLARPSRSPGEVVQPLDAFFGDGHGD